MAGLVGNIALAEARAVRQRAFAIKPSRTGSAVGVRERAAEVRGSNPLSSTRKSGRPDVISYGTG
jgi:hypothetical protein